MGVRLERPTPPRPPEPPALGGPDGGVAELAALVRLCAASGAEREVLWLRPARLPRGLDRPHHQRLLREAMDPGGNGRRARLFHLPGGEAVVVGAPGAVRPALQRALEGAGEEEALTEAVRVLRLPGDAAAMLVALEESLGLVPPAPASRAAPRPPLGTAALGTALRALARAEPLPFLRRRSVRRLAPGGVPEAIAESLSPHDAALAERLFPGLDPAPAPALAGRLRAALAERTLAWVAGPDWRARPAPLHLVLPVEALVGEAMLALDAALPRALRPLLTLCVPAEGVLAAPAAYALGRDWLRARGYRLGLEAPGGAALALLPPAALGVSLLRLAWSPGLPSAPGPAAALARGGEVSLVLTGADRAAAVAWGWESGIALFEGRAAERRR